MMTSVSVLDWKIDPWPDQLVAQLDRIDQIAVVADRHLAVRAVDQERLRVGHPALAGRRVRARARSRIDPGSSASVRLSNTSAT